MAYMSQETKGKIVEACRPILKKYGIKATWGVDNHSTIVLNVKAGKIDFFTNYAETMQGRPGKRQDVVDQIVRDRYMQVNQYWLDDTFSGKALDCMNELFRTIKSAGEWFDDSDAMTDYFHTAYYIRVNLGKWNKPYIVE